MSNSPKVFREVTLKSAIKCLKDMGEEIGGVEITSNGTVRVLTASAAGSLTEAPADPNPFDRPATHARRA